MKISQKTSKLLVVAVVILLSGMSLAFKANIAPEKITVCHMPPGNVENCHEISVSMNALQAHLDHGDNLVCHDEMELEVYSSIYRVYLLAQPTSSIQLIY